jgi:hopanoid biosynthesis associated protein HpnK
VDVWQGESPMVKKLILTADDFGFSLAVNEAIEEAHRNGVLSTASLMVGAGAAGDAVDRACRLRSLRVGLHLVLVDGSSISPPHTIPSLVNLRSEFSSHLFRAGIDFCFRAGVRQQLEREIRAQFQAFRDTGLDLDHVNCHKHMHLHPTIGGLMLKVGREYGLRAVRYPYEPVFPSWRASQKNLGQKLLSLLFLWPWLILLKKQLQQARVRSNNFVFGMNDSGNMHLNLVLRFLQYLPSGVTEIYFHPASHSFPEIGQTMSNYQCEEEFATLTSSALGKVLRDSNIQRIVFSDL